MKKLFTLIVVTCLGLSTQAQTTLWSESFDSASAPGYAVTLGGEGLDLNPTYGTTSDYFFRTSGTYFFFTGSSTTMYNGNTGDFFAAQDVDDGGWTGSATPSQLTWTGINIAGYSALNFEGLFASIATAKIDAADYVTVEYSIDGGPWTALLDFRNDGTTSNTEFLEDSNFDGVGDQNNLDSNFMSFNKSIPGIGLTLDLRITASVNAGGEDMAWDEFKVTGVLAAFYQPNINSFTPANGSTDVSITTDLTITLDTATMAGTGMIHLVNNTGGADIDIAASSADVSFNAKTVTVTNLSLDHETDYTVLIDSDAFVLSTGEVSTGIYDITRWNFRTTMAADTVMILNSTFDDCGAVTGYAASFKIHNPEGSKNWRCSIYGHNDSNAVYMNGYSNGGPQTNLDYLVSPAINNGGSALFMSFWQKRRFNGNNDAEVVYSTDYDGISSPETFTWTAIYQDNGSQDTVWNEVQNLDLSAVASSVFYVAFRYTSDSVTNSGAFEWSIDDITMTTDNADAVSNLYTSGLDVDVIGNPVQNGTLKLAMDLPTGMNLQATMSTIMGQEVRNIDFYAPAGQSDKSVDVSGLAPGLYLLQVRGESNGAVLKVMID